MSLAEAIAKNFLGNAPRWYKLTIVGFLLLNPLVLHTGGVNATLLCGWLLLFEFIFTLALALKCYPLQPGGLLALEAMVLGLTSPASVYDELLTALPLLLLLVFMVAGIYFLKELLLFAFTRVLLGIRSQVGLSVGVCLTAAVLSAFMGALTVIAVLVTIAASFYDVFHRFASGRPQHDSHDTTHDAHVHELHREDLEALRAFLCGLIMHGAIGTALGGVMTPVGEPQNLLIARQVDWTFTQYVTHVGIVGFPALLAGLATCAFVERLRWFGYGMALPSHVREVLVEYAAAHAPQVSSRERALLMAQALTAVLLVAALVLQLAEIGLIGIFVLVLATALTGINDEPRIGKAFTGSLPFAALLVVFLVIVAVLRDQFVFEPLVDWAVGQQGASQVAKFYLLNGGLSIVSDNVFVATLFISEIKAER